MKNYLNQVKNDVLDYIAENIDGADWIDDRDGLEEHLYEECWISDSVTGNASGSYYCNSYKAREAVFEDYDTVRNALEEFETPDRIGKLFLDEEWELIDLTARCYVLGQAISDVLDTLEAGGFFEAPEENKTA